MIYIVVLLINAFFIVIAFIDIYYLFDKVACVSKMRQITAGVFYIQKTYFKIYTVKWYNNLFIWNSSIIRENKIYQNFFLFKSKHKAIYITDTLYVDLFNTRNWRCCHIAVLPYCSVAISQCCHIAVLPFRNDAISQCCHIAVLPYRSVAISQCCHIAVLKNLTRNIRWK